MFNTKHYIPILKWKGAERKALEKLSDKEKMFITPVVQIIMPQPKNINDGVNRKGTEELLNESIATLKVKLPVIAVEILKYWGKAPAFLDLSLIDVTLREEGFSKILSTGQNLGMCLIPVISLNFGPKIQAIVASLAMANKHGLCLRISRADFINQVKLDRRIADFLSKYNLSEKAIDLLVDFQAEPCPKLSDLNQEIPHLLKWRTFTLACGAFPVDLMKCVLGKNYIPRSDWNSWISQINTQKIQRQPSFADYTIQHPIYKESYQFFPPSASIRYTLKDKWLVMRGQRRRSAQYLANAQLLSQDKDFFGEGFSYGDTYIVEKGKNLKGKTGSATTWLVAGINHHLVCTIAQIAKLP